MVKWMIPSILDGDWSPSPTEKDQLKTMFRGLTHSLDVNGDEEALSMAQHAEEELIEAVMSMKEPIVMKSLSK